MGTFTPNYNLFKPDGTDLVDEEVDLNDNWDIVDGTLNSLADTNAAQDTLLTSHTATLADHETRLDVLDGVGPFPFTYTLVDLTSPITIPGGADTTIPWDESSGIVTTPWTTLNFTDGADNIGWYHVIVTVLWEQTVADGDIRMIKLLEDDEVKAVAHAPTAVGSNDNANSCTLSWIGHLGVPGFVTPVKIVAWQNSGGPLDILDTGGGSPTTRTYAEFFRLR